MTSQTRAGGFELLGLPAQLRSATARRVWSRAGSESMRLSNLPGSSSNEPSSSLAKEDVGRYFVPNCKDFAHITNIQAQAMCCSNGLSVPALCSCRLAAFISCSTGMAATTSNAFEICLPEHNQRCLLLFFNGAQSRNANHRPVDRRSGVMRSLLLAFLAML